MAGTLDPAGREKLRRYVLRPPQLRVTLPDVRAVTLAGLGEAEIQVKGQESLEHRTH